MSSIGQVSNSYLQSIFDKSLNQESGAQATPANRQSDSSQLSPFAQLINTLDRLQQSDPAKYRAVTQQVATNLQSAAQTAQNDGDSGAATQLNQLSREFANASQNGNLPSLQDVANAPGAHHADTGNTSKNPAEIIANTLSKAGVSISS